MDVTVSFQAWIFGKYATTDGVNLVEHISRMAKFYNS